MSCPSRAQLVRPFEGWQQPFRFGGRMSAIAETGRSGFARIGIGSTQLLRRHDGKRQGGKTAAVRRRVEGEVMAECDAPDASVAEAAMARGERSYYPPAQIVDPQAVGARRRRTAVAADARPSVADRVLSASDRGSTYWRRAGVGVCSQQRPPSRTHTPDVGNCTSGSYSPRFANAAFAERRG